MADGLKALLRLSEDMLVLAKNTNFDALTSAQRQFETTMKRSMINLQALEGTHLRQELSKLSQNINEIRSLSHAHQMGLGQKLRRFNHGQRAKNHYKQSSRLK